MLRAACCVLRVAIDVNAGTPRADNFVAQATT